MTQRNENLEFYNKRLTKLEERLTALTISYLPLKNYRTIR